MAEPVAPEWSPAERAYADAMRAELDWAPLHFDGWSHYEQARPLLPGETVEVIGFWPELGYMWQYRPSMGEMAQAWQTPVDYSPEITVLGSIDQRDLSELRSLVGQERLDDLVDAAARIAKADRTIPTEPPLRTGSTIPALEEVPIHYIPSEGRWLREGRLIHEDHPSAAYAVAGRFGIRLGPPVGLTPTGLLVFEPSGVDGLRLTIEHPVNEPVRSLATEARLGLYSHDGLGGWRQTATVHEPGALEQFLVPEQSPVSKLALGETPSRLPGSSSPFSI